MQPKCMCIVVDLKRARARKEPEVLGQCPFYNNASPLNLDHGVVELIDQAET